MHATWGRKLALSFQREIGSQLTCVHRHPPSAQAIPFLGIYPKVSEVHPHCAQGIHPTLFVVANDEVLVGGIAKEFW